jgi:hypothetical protein
MATEPIVVQLYLPSYNLGSMARQRGDPDRRGMGAESDAISEQFVPNERYKVQQRAMVETLTAAGLGLEQIASMLLVPVDLPPDKRAKGEKLEEKKPTDADDR